MVGIMKLSNIQDGAWCVVAREGYELILDYGFRSVFDAAIRAESASLPREEWLTDDGYLPTLCVLLTEP
jgi:hypothetical protein